jgi:hypothetical protein
VDGLHASETLNGVTAVTRKFFGVVGFVLSPQASADPAEVITSPNARILKHEVRRKLLNKEKLHAFDIIGPFSIGDRVTGDGQTISSL